jgi:hypothetical protein
MRLFCTSSRVYTSWNWEYLDGTRDRGGRGGIKEGRIKEGGIKERREGGRKEKRTGRRNVRVVRGVAVVFFTDRGVMLRLAAVFGHVLASGVAKHLRIHRCGHDRKL